MPVVTALKPTRAAGRFAVHIDGSYAFAVGEAFVARHGLFEGLELSASDDERLRADASGDQALTHALHLLAHRARSRDEIYRRLLAKGHEAPVAERVVERLTADGFIDDRAFAAAFVADKVNLSGWGSRRIERELAGLGVARAAVDEAVAGIDREAEAARANAALRRRGPAQPPFDRARKRAYEFLLRRGFPAETARPAVAAWVDEARGPD